MDIDGWLRGIGLAQYARDVPRQRHRRRPTAQLTDEHLRDIGSCRSAIARSCWGRCCARRNSCLVPEPRLPEPRSTPAERRQVTVMFSDLVGSTALSGHMDPEDLREVISAYQKCVAETVRRFGGFVAKYMGDGVLVYFGYPQAHEDDAERAVRAGLETDRGGHGAQDRRSRCKLVSASRPDWWWSAI